MAMALDGTLVPAYEIMHMNNNIRTLIRENKSHQIDNAITTGSRDGMISMDQSIYRLLINLLALSIGKQIGEQTGEADYKNQAEQDNQAYGAQHCCFSTATTGIGRHTGACL